MRFRNSYLSIVFMAISGIGICQDTRNVREPKFPAVCHVLLADEKTLEDGTLAVFGNQEDESAVDTKRLQAALDDCRPGLAVELSLGNAHRFDAFLIDPIRVPVGVSMIVDGGVTVFASSNPEHYQVLGATAQCGSVARVGGACQPLLLFQGDSGLYGYGVIDGRGYSKMTSGPNAGRAWWELTTSLRQGENQNIPELVTVDGNNFTIYKITLRHAPYYHLQWTGDGLIVWGLKIQSVWNVPNTDGINIWGTHATVRDSVISEGDDDIAIDARHIPAGQITIDNVTAYSRNGLSIGSGIAKGVANVLIENSHLTGGIVSLSGTSVNGVRLDDMKRLGVTEYQQALPSRAPNIRGLNIKTRPEAGGFARDITFENICIKDLNIPIEIAPYFGRTEGKKIPEVSGIVYKNIHVLAPDAQGLNRYTVNMRAYGPDKRNEVTFDNVFFDDIEPGTSSVRNVVASYNSFSYKGGVYPPSLAQLAASASRTLEVDGTKLELRDNTAKSIEGQTSPPKPYECPATDFPFLTGDLYAVVGSGNEASSYSSGKEVTLHTTDPLELRAVVEPSMSTITYFARGAYQVNPGLLAVGAPLLRGNITFFATDQHGKRLRFISVPLTANGTLAATRIRKLKPGKYTLSAEYPGDQYYPSREVGHILVNVVNP